MNISLKKVIWIIILCVMVMCIVSALFQMRRGKNVEQSLADTRQALRQQGFKTDLADFNFSTDAAPRAREAALSTFSTPLRFNASGARLEFMPTVGNNAVIVIWKQDWVKTGSDEIHWPDLREALDGSQWALDAACDAILSGPIRFNLDASKGSKMLLRPLASLRNLSLALSSREVLELHEKNPDAAWTNLLAATRLATAWEPEPAEVLHIVRFRLAASAFDDAWQALQSTGWPDEKLAGLQHEWEMVNFFTNLPDTAAFSRASAVAMCQQQRHEPLAGGISFADLVKEAVRSPAAAASELKNEYNEARYRSSGTYDDEKNLLLYYQNRELEIRHAIQSPTWADMCAMPGVTNIVAFKSPYRSRLQTLLNMQQMSMRLQLLGGGLLGRAAEVEARRRILITAIALERYHGKHGAYPATLTELAPDFLKSVPLDFMDGQPLRYRLTDDGHFMLYSVGLDSVDNGGKIPLHSGDEGFERPGRLGSPLPENDIVWPRPATTAEVEELHRREVRAREMQNQRQLEQESEVEWEQSPLRQARTEKILATKWNPNAGNMTFEGQPLGDYIRNEKFTGTNLMSLADLLTPRQVITGAEPEDLTFEMPVSYKAITNIGSLVLMVDADLEEPMTADTGGKMQELSRATNGNCLVVWHTIYDPPGRHAIQVQLTAMTERGGEFCGKGPAILVNTTNLCQFSLDSSTYDVELGATFHARLPEVNCLYKIECLTTNGEHLATLTGSTTNGEFKTVWNLMDEHGHRLNGETFNSVIHLTLPDSGRTQTLRGP